MTSQPVNTDLVPNYADIFDDLKDQPWNSVDGVTYGIPHGRGANLLMYNTDVVNPGARRPGARCSTRRRHVQGQDHAYDSPIYIADAALYLMETKPDLGIKNPYALDQNQLDAAVDLLKQQKPHHRRVLVGLPQGGPGVQAATRARHHLAGDRQPRARHEKVPVEVHRAAQGGRHRLVGHLDGLQGTENPNCVYKWMDYIVSPEVNAQVAEYFGEAPANEKACELTATRTTATSSTPTRPRTGRSLLLDDADRGVPRRPHRRQVHDLRRVGQGLDRVRS